MFYFLLTKFESSDTLIFISHVITRTNNSYFSVVTQNVIYIFMNVYRLNEYLKQYSNIIVIILRIRLWYNMVSRKNVR